LSSGLQRYKAGYCGLPLSLFGASRFKTMRGIREERGKRLIKLFSCPVKANKGKRHENQNLPRGPAGKVGRV
jgi:hypothetical protein